MYRTVTQVPKTSKKKKGKPPPEAAPSFATNAHFAALERAPQR